MKMSDGISATIKGAIRSFFEYDTPKIVHIKSIKVGLMNRLIQLAILGYIIGYAIVYEKGYQEIDDVVSACSSKVKGVTYTNISYHDGVQDSVYQRIWDVADYVIPPQENNAFFVMTNAIITKNQTQSECPEDPTKTVARCDKSANNCTRGEPIPNGNGIQTGECKQAYDGQYTCEIYAWCPVERDDDFPQGKGIPLLNGTEDYTVLLKNQIEFPKFKVKRRNILTDDPAYLASCRYNRHDPQDRYCPIFRLGDIAREAGENYTELATYGGFISINIRWDCDLDKGEERCKPEYSFRRLDDKNSAIAKGWNFRYANFYYEDGVQFRDLTKAYGIRFIINVNGQAGKFSFIPLAFNLGSGLALLAIATIVSDFLTIYVLKKGYFYRDRKYLYVQDVDNVEDLYEDGDAAPKIRSNEENPQVTEDKSLVSSQHNSYDAVGSSTNKSQANVRADESAGSKVRHRPGEYNRLDEED